MILKTADLNYGVNRPQEWWDEHPKVESEYQLIKKSIEEKGIRNPLKVTYRKDLGWTVEVGNQRLRAAQELNIMEINCVIERPNDGL
jgi:ParB-like chromosome segregation protein Spo0J|tara:strand:+ start:969 stop:1229 length:261 start_codon:yes stop_codon:yes gene_type:complete